MTPKLNQRLPSPVPSQMGRRVGFLCVVVFALVASLAAATEKVSFKRVPAAILKMDGKQVRFWDIYQAEKNSNRLLIQLGRRYLLLDIEEREVLELAPDAIESKPKNKLIVARAPENETRLESEQWNLRNVGPALAIKVFLSKEGRQLEIQLPQRPDERRAW